MEEELGEAFFAPLVTNDTARAALTLVEEMGQVMVVEKEDEENCLSLPEDPRAVVDPPEELL